MLQTTPKDWKEPVEIRPHWSLQPRIPGLTEWTPEWALIPGAKKVTITPKEQIKDYMQKCSQIELNDFLRSLCDLHKRVIAHSNVTIKSDNPSDFIQKKQEILQGLNAAKEDVAKIRSMIAAPQRVGYDPNNKITQNAWTAIDDLSNGIFYRQEMAEALLDGSSFPDTDDICATTTLMPKEPYHYAHYDLTAPTDVTLFKGYSGHGLRIRKNPCGKSASASDGSPLNLTFHTHMCREKWQMLISPDNGIITGPDFKGGDDSLWSVVDVKGEGGVSKVIVRLHLILSEKQQASLSTMLTPTGPNQTMGTLIKSMSTDRAFKGSHILTDLNGLFHVSPEAKAHAEKRMRIERRNTAADKKAADKSGGEKSKAAGPALVKDAAYHARKARQAAKAATAKKAGADKG